MIKYFLEIQTQLITSIWYCLLNTDEEKSIANIRHGQILSRDTDTTYNKYMVLCFRYSLK